MHYRSEIDGLRAVAVIPVILFHAGFSVFSGGYIGVDIFFVISGYLITTKLLEDIERGEFSLLGFYDRRARRILPALIFVIIGCLPFAWLWMLPNQMKDFGQSLIAVSFFASNILFWREEGYFAAASEDKPLLHTWSLAVEEQYYLVFPIFLFLVWRCGRTRVFWIIVVLAIFSLMLSELGWRRAPTANFYLIPTRMWELFAGSITAFILRDKVVQKSEWLSWVGITTITASVFAYDSQTPFPSLYALVPVGGTVLLILFSDPSTKIGRLLSSKTLVGIGLISYSAYLWHQPLFAFTRIRSLHEPPMWLMAVLSVLAFVLAVFSWRYVEQPFRRKLNPFPAARSSLLAVAAMSILTVSAIGAIAYSTNGLDARLDARAKELLASSANRASRVCHYSEGKPYVLPSQACAYPSSTTATGRVLVTGDSHAMAISSELSSSLNMASLDVYNASYSSCIPLVGFRTFDAVPSKKCAQFVEDVYAFAAASEVDTVVLAARFPLYYWGSRYDNKEGGVEPGEHVYVDASNVKYSAWDSADRRARVLALYEKKIIELAKQFNVVLLGPIPEAGWDVPQYEAQRHRLARHARTTMPGTSFDAYLERSEPILNLFEALAGSNESIAFVPLHNALCDDETGRCRTMQNGTPLYFDNNHLNLDGARLVAPMVSEAVLGLNQTNR